MASALLILAAYLLGSLSFAVIASRLCGLPDPRSYGSGNPGATNVWRTGKKAAAVLTLLGDAGKGWVAVWLAARLVAGGWAQDYAVDGAALAVLIGHVYPVFYGFRGGKGVATSLGVLLALDVWLGLAALATWIVVALAFRISSLAALTTAALAPFYAYGFFGVSRHTVVVLLMALLLVWRHQSNIRSLLAGRESAIGSGPPPR
jgi:acyl phosphate:glycerol-3-phosphate acyltransferase